MTIKHFKRRSKPADVIKTMYKVSFPEKVDTNGFLVVRETLKRMGIESTKRGVPVLWQSCHILHKSGSYYICHFKQMLALDGCEVVMTNDDYKRLNKIVSLLQGWGIINKEHNISNRDCVAKLKIVRATDVDDWVLKSKHSLGTKD